MSKPPRDTFQAPRENIPPESHTDVDDAALTRCALRPPGTCVYGALPEERRITDRPDLLGDAVIERVCVCTIRALATRLRARGLFCVGDLATWSDTRMTLNKVRAPCVLVPHTVSAVTGRVELAAWFQREHVILTSCWPWSFFDPWSVQHLGDVIRHDGTLVAAVATVHRMAGDAAVIELLQATLPAPPKPRA